MEYRIAYDTTKYVRENIEEVQHTLLEAFVLVMLVVFVFLQGFRATLIPMLAIPVSLIASFAAMAVLGFSINTLTLCGLILAIGLVVDDAIIVVENVEKFLHRGLDPTAAVRAAMAEITAPIVTIMLVLAAVFIPVTFIPGLTGRLYNQFALTIVASFLFSGINSLTFSPAMARLFLRPKHGPTRFPPFVLFNRGLKWIEDSYDSFLDFGARFWPLIVVPSLALLALTAYMLAVRPKAFIPNEDQGYLIVSIQTPDGTTREPTTRIAKRVGELAQKLPGAADVVLLDGFNALGGINQTNSATAFVTLKDWSERTRPELRSGALAGQLQQIVSQQIRGARVLVFPPPPIQGLSTTGGFEFMLEDRDGKGIPALAGVVDRFLDETRKRPELAGVFTSFSARVPQLRFDLDRTKARRLDVPVSDVFATLQTNLGGVYVNDFNLYGKVWKVIIQAEGAVRSRPEDILNLYTLNRQGEKVPLSSLGEVANTLGPIDVAALQPLQRGEDQRPARPRLQLRPGRRRDGGGRRRRRCPKGFGYEWTGTTYQEQKTGDIAVYIFALSIVTVFLFMSALYESWVRPLVILFSVPLATFGAVVGLWFYDMPLDIFGQIGLVMLIGLETKNAILIVEFGVELRHKGYSIIDSAKEASRVRLRPILMTSFAFIMGVLPMARATGAGAYSRNSLGVVIAFGMLISTILGRFVIPIYYVLGERLIDRFSGPPNVTATPPDDGPGVRRRPRRDRPHRRDVSDLGGRSRPLLTQSPSPGGEYSPKPGRRLAPADSAPC